MPGGDHERRRDLFASLGLAAFVLIFFLDILVAGLNLYIRDIPRTYYPDRAVIASILQSHDFPFWNPFAPAGQPLAANPAYEIFYPPQWLVALGNLRDMVHLEVVLHFPFAAIGMYLLGRSLRLTRIAAGFGGFIYALGGTMLALGSLWPFLFAASWLPWVALTVHRALKAPTLRRIASAAICSAFVLLIADVSMILQTFALMAAYALYRAWKQRRWQPVAIVTAIAAISIAIGAAQIFPAIDHQRDCGRSVALGQATATVWSMAPLRPLELIWPTLFGSATPDGFFFWGVNRLYPSEQLPFFLAFYPGIAAAVLMIAGFARRIRGWGFAAGVLAVGFLMAIGRYGLLFPLLYRAGLQSLRYPEKFFIAPLFTLTVFATVAADESLRELAVRRVAAVTAAIVAALSALVLLATLTSNYPVRFAAFWNLPAVDADFAQRFQRGMLTTFALAAIAAVLFASERMSPRLRLASLALLVVVDLGIRCGGYMPRTTADFYDEPPAARALASQRTPVRLYSHADWQRRSEPQAPLPIGLRPWIIRNGLLPSSENAWGFQAALDLDPNGTKLLPSIEFDRVVEYARRLRPDRMPLLLQMTGATHVSTLIPFNRAVVEDPRQFDRIDPVRIDSTGYSRFYFADAVLAAPTLQDAARVIFSDAALPLRAALTDVTFAPAAGRVIAAHESTNRIQLDVDSRGRSFLVLAITPHRYWHATSDGVDVPIHRTNVGFQGVIVDRGRHRVTFEYHNGLVVACAWISAIALIATIAFAVSPRSREPLLQ